MENAKNDSGKKAKASDPISKVKAAITEAMAQDHDILDLVTTLQIAVANAVFASAERRVRGGVVRASKDGEVAHEEAVQ